MQGVVDALVRHPLKGFTPELLERVVLRPGQGFPFDRVFAVEDGPSGFDPEAPAHMSKMKFTVLAKIAAVAQVRTRFDDATGIFHAQAPGAAPISVRLSEEADRARFAAWLADFLGDRARGPLRVLPAPNAHRFFDHPQGAVSLINVASVRDIQDRIGRRVDPLRFRANIYVSGWPAWCERGSASRVRLGAVTARVFAPITRCAATHVDPALGERDVDMVEILNTEFGANVCGLYLHFEEGGELKRGDEVALLP